MAANFAEYLTNHSHSREEFTRLVEILSKQSDSRQAHMSNILAGFREYSEELHNVSTNLIDILCREPIDIDDYRSAYEKHTEAITEFCTIIQDLRNLKSSRTEAIRNIILGLQKYFAAINFNMEKIHSQIDIPTPFEFPCNVDQIKRIGSQYSSPFYVSRLGYRFKALFTIQQNAVYIYIRLLPGVNDAFIDFPFNKAIRTTLVDRQYPYTTTEKTESLVQVLTVDPVDEIEANKWIKQTDDDDDDINAWSYVASFPESLFESFKYIGSVVIRIDVSKPVNFQSKNEEELLN